MSNHSQFRGAKGLVGLAFLAMALVSFPLKAVSATAFVSVRILGHADAEVAQGAVTITKLSDSGFDAVPPVRSGSGPGRADRTISTFRVGGGQNATFAVSLPDAVTVTSDGGRSELAVSGFRTNASSRRFAADGTATVAIDASVSIPAGQAGGQYSGSYPVTIAYD